MPEMTILHQTSAATASKATTRRATTTFTGDVYMDAIHSDTTPPPPQVGVRINSVFFTPRARTFWHEHSHGQLLTVTAGSGWVCDRGGKPQQIGVGDVVWCPAGTVHWHGAASGSFMCHLAVSHGETNWLEEVREEEYVDAGR